MLKLGKKWLEKLRNLPETGMGYQVVTITLKNGQVFPQAIVDSGYVTRIRSLDSIQFSESDIAEIRVTHEKWDWMRNP